jgi:hypothetical protein
LTEQIWKKPVITLFKEHYPKMETEPFAVIKTKKLTLSKTPDGTITGNIQDFFTLMGDIDIISSPEAKNEQYILCWFDDTEEDTTKDLRRMSGVTFPTKLTYTLNENGKRTYNTTFTAKHGKLK